MPAPTTVPDQQHKHRRHRNGESSRGYDAGDDTDSTPDEYRRRQQSQIGLAPTPNATTAEDKRRHHRRRKSHDPSSSSAASSSSKPRPPTKPEVDRNATVSPASDDTVDLPERFDEHGRRKPVPGEDPLTDKLEEILSRNGLGRRLFGNFADGLLGGSRGASGSGDADGSNRRRR